jgi:hypothetical protein
VVASIDLRQYDPLVVTFGTPRALDITVENPCTDFNAEKHYRFVNTVKKQDTRRRFFGNKDNEPVYDSVAMSDTTGSQTLGLTLLLDDVNWPIAYPEFNDDTTRDPQKRSAHSQDLYRDRINAIYERGCFPVPIGKWTQGHYCQYNDECVSLFCDDEKCT